MSSVWTDLSRRDFHGGMVNSEPLLDSTCSSRQWRIGRSARIARISEILIQWQPTKAKHSPQALSMIVRIRHLRPSLVPPCPNAIFSSPSLPIIFSGERFLNSVHLPLRVLNSIDIRPSKRAQISCFNWQTNKARRLSNSAAALPMVG